MILGTRCTTCGDRVERAHLVECDRCGRLVHDRCKTYETNFECPDCADELDVGVMEL